MARENPDDLAIVNMVDNYDFYRFHHKLNYTSLLHNNTRVVYFKANLDYTDGFKKSRFFQHHPLVQWMKGKTRDVIYAGLYHTLFKPAPRLQTRLDHFLSPVKVKVNPPADHRLICAHFRMGRNPSIPTDSASRQTESDLPVVWDFLRSQIASATDRIFIMSDSDDVIEASKRQDFRDRLLLTSGKVLHVDKAAKNATDVSKCEGFEKIVLEQQVLLHCDVLMISKSGISRYAAFVRQSDDGLYCLLGSKIEKCKMSQLKELYHLMG